MTVDQITDEARSWERLRARLDGEKEVVLWVWTRQNDDLIRVWLPVIIYAPFTPLRLKKKIMRMFNCERVILMAKKLINENPSLMRELIDEGFGIICISEKAPEPLEVL